jgi:hypothetical protein
MALTGTILNAICKELQSFFTLTEYPETTVLLDTQANEDNLALHTLPFVIVSMTDSPDYAQLPGGSTQYAIDISLKVYQIEPNSALDDDSGYSIHLLDIIDDIRDHISRGIWQSQSMIDISASNSFKMALQNVIKSESMAMQNGIVPGFAINYSTIAIDHSTNHVSNGPVLTTVENIPDTPELIVDVSSLTFVHGGETNQANITSNLRYQISSNAAWLTSNYTTGIGNQVIAITATANPGTTSRTGIITIKYLGVYTKAITCVQN